MRRERLLLLQLQRCLVTAPLLLQLLLPVPKAAAVLPLSRWFSSWQQGDSADADLLPDDPPYVPPVPGAAVVSAGHYAASVLSGTFTCLDGEGAGMPLSRVNDDFCDCSDGSDEPGTAACAGAVSDAAYTCPNAGYQPLVVPASRVRDGVCDCCDGSDESGRVPLCANTCVADAKEWRHEQAQLRRELKKGLAARAILAQQGFALRVKAEEEAEVRQMQLAVAQARKDEVDAALQEAESEEAAQREALLAEARAALAACCTAQVAALPDGDATEALAVAVAGAQLKRRTSAEHGVNAGEPPEAVMDLEGLVAAAQAAAEQGSADSLAKALRAFVDSAGATATAAAPGAAAGAGAPDDASAEPAAAAGDEVQAAAEELADEEDTFTHDDADEYGGGASDVFDEYGDVPHMDDDGVAIPHAGGADMHDVPAADGPGDSKRPHGVAGDSEGDAGVAAAGEGVPVGGQGAGAAAPQPLRLPRLLLQLKHTTEEAEHARKLLREAQNGLRAAERSANAAAGDLETDYGPDWLLRSSKDSCLSFDTPAYTYEVCPYGSATQKPRGGGGNVSLGTWSSLLHAGAGAGENGGSDSGSELPPTGMLWEHGQRCWNGPDRSLRCRLRCAEKQALEAVEEPETCAYTCVIATPAACAPPPPPPPQLQSADQAQQAQAGPGEEL